MAQHFLKMQLLITRVFFPGFFSFLPISAVSTILNLQKSILGTEILSSKQTLFFWSRCFCGTAVFSLGFGLGSILFPDDRMKCFALMGGIELVWLERNNYFPVINLIIFNTVIIIYLPVSSKRVLSFSYQHLTRGFCERRNDVDLFQKYIPCFACPFILGIYPARVCIQPFVSGHD